MNPASEAARPHWEAIGPYEVRDSQATTNNTRDGLVHRDKETNTTYMGQHSKDGYKAGLGTEITTEGEVYSGNYVRDQRHGTGRLFKENGDVYEGDFKYGLPDGKGNLKEISGFVYDGEFKNGVKSGYGVETAPDGTIHEGLYKDDLKNGKGVWSFTDGSKFEGTFKDGFCHGYGVFTYAKNSRSVRYEGDYAEGGYKHGKGKLWMSNGYVYEGDFTRDKMTGKATITIPGKGVFEGSYLDGKRHGIVRYTKKSGKVTVAEYNKDKKVKSLPANTKLY